MRNTLTCTSAQWDEILSGTNGHLLQSWAWGQLKSHFGWTPCRLQVDGAAAQILFKHLPLGQTIAYIPKGPLLNWGNTAQCQALLSVIHAEARKQQAIFLKIEPNVWSTADVESTEQAVALTNFLNQAAFTPSDPIQPQTSIVVDISGDEDSILAAMKQKTRYNIRLAQRKGVIIRRGTQADISTFHHLARLTSDRDGFDIHSLDYYQTAHRLFSPNHCVLLIAEFEDEPLAALMAFKQGQTAYYFYGASSNTRRNLMPTYLIQWEAMRWAKRYGCTHYDLWGIPNVDTETLELEFTDRTKGLWGVYRFKRGFGGQIVRSVGAYDYVYNPLLYKLYKLYRGEQNS